MRRMYNLGMIIGILLFHSCGTSHHVRSSKIQKRKYTKGFHITKSGKRFKSEKQELQEKNQEEVAEIHIPLSKPQQSQSDIASIEPVWIDPNSDNERSYEKLSEERNPGETECDVILLKNGEEVSAKVTELGAKEIKYKKCENQQGPTYTFQKDEVFKIKYSNGTSELISPLKTSKAKGLGDEAPKVQIAMGMSIGGILFGILGGALFLTLPVLSIVFGAIAILSGIIALIMVSKEEYNRGRLRVKSLATWAIVLGVFGLLLGIFWVGIF